MEQQDTICRAIVRFAATRRRKKEGRTEHALTCMSWIAWWRSVDPSIAP
jgi:hypothetical protein